MMAGGGANLAGVNANAAGSGSTGLNNVPDSIRNDTTMTYPGPQQPATSRATPASLFGLMSTPNYGTQTSQQSTYPTQQSASQPYQYGPFAQQTNPYASQQLGNMSNALTGYAQPSRTQGNPYAPMYTSQPQVDSYAQYAQQPSNPYQYNPYAQQPQSGYGPFTAPQNFQASLPQQFSQMPQGLQDQLQSFFSSLPRSNYDPTKAASMAAQQQQYSQTNDAGIAQQKSEQIARAKAAQDAYNKAQADKKAAAEKAAAEAASQAEREGWEALFGNSAARGGDVGIAGLRRRK